MKRPFRLAVLAPSFVMLTVSLSAARDQGGQHFGTIMRWFRRGLPLAVEGIMLVGSARLAYTLLSNQGYFDRVPGPYDWLVGFGAPYSFEWVWGMVAGSAALLKGIGLFLCLTYRRDPVMLDLGYGIRMLGWLASCIVWGAFSASLSIWDPLALTSIASSCALGMALWGLLMGPAMPDDDIG